MGSTRGSLAAVVLLAASALAGCRDEGPAVHVFTRSGEETVLRVRVADDEDGRRAALTTPLGPGESLLFRFPTEDRHALPRNETGADVDVLYASPLQTIVEVQRNVAAGTAPPAARAPWVSALVVAGGFVERKNVMIGEKFDPRRVAAPTTP